MEETILVILGALLLLYLSVPYLKTFLDKQKRETMENICETKYHMNKYKYKNKKVKDPYSYVDTDTDKITPPMVRPNLPLSIPSLPHNLQTLSTLTTSTIDDNDNDDNSVIGRNTRITGFFTDTSFYP
jgi:hypothetical protein